MSSRINGSTGPQDDGLGDVVRALNVVAQAMQQQVNLNQNAPPPPPPPPPNQRALLVRRFIEQRHDSFKDSPDPLVVEDWIDKIEKIFTLLNVNDEDKLNLAVYKLENEATRWWDMTLRSRNDGLFNWVEFQLAFLNKYFPQTTGNQRMIEFMLLTQRNMTVEQYQAKLEELSRFAPHLVENEELKTFKFQEGLNPSIKSRLSVLKSTSYTEIVERAMIAERELEETARILERHAGDRNGNDENKNHRYKSKENINYAQRHLQHVVCFECKQPGHYKRKCPQLGAQRDQQPSVAQRQNRDNL
ncbi:uncharacterized protein LOC113331270 [Papaver somniferum]|uniref:uncharacterized protein LOC113331270 n=1 Tax=Papaver somniferum TaxID=3469 RepID=UPI000E6F9580|nr:uncharacterized protein LOC113331270 [Papaver somniferum]